MNGIRAEIKGLKPIDKAYFFVMLLLMGSIVFNNAVNSISIMLLLVVWLIERGFNEKWKQVAKEPFFILNALLFLCYIVSIGVSDDKSNARFFLVKNLSLLVLPLILLSGKRFSFYQVQLFLKTFVFCVFLLMSVESFLALIKFLNMNDPGGFFYHNLVGGIKMGGAIIASFFCLFSVAFLLYLPGREVLKWPLIALFSIWIVLLDSKLFLCVLLLMLLIHVFYRFSNKLKMAIVVAVVLFIGILVLTRNPVKQRFVDLNHFQASYLTDTTFNPGIYFDGLSLRLVFVRFGFQILKENGNYVLGTGTGDAEYLLKKKIVEYHMYTGDGVKDKQGYLQYGYHNQYLQKLIQLGLTGFLLFMAALIYCFYLSIKFRNKLLLNLMIIFNFSFFTDTLLEHQIGLVSYLVFTCLCIGIIRSKQQETAEGTRPYLISG